MVFEVNGVEYNQIEIANWSHEQHSRNLDLQTNFNEQKLHIWSTRVMDAAKWNTLEALKGQIISLSTTNHEDRNSPTHRLYPNTKIRRISGNHVALHVADVEIEFTVI